MAETENRVISGRYELRKAIGKGGMAQVYMAYDQQLDRNVAIKLLREEHLKDKELCELFRREARNAARLQHPNIVNVYDVDSEGGKQYIVMEYVEGTTLRNFMKQQRLRMEDALEIGIRLAYALQHAHENRVIHCDIKPLNILIDKNLNPKIADFGIAKVISNQTMVYRGDVLGSVHYISPEQVDNQKITAASDVYSLGVVLFEMLTGKVPYSGQTLAAISAMHVNGNMPQLKEYMEEVPEGLQEIMDKALAKNPEDRYAEAFLLAKDLQGLKQKLFPGSAVYNVDNINGYNRAGLYNTDIDDNDPQAATMVVNRNNLEEQDLEQTMRMTRELRKTGFIVGGEGKRAVVPTPKPVENLPDTGNENSETNPVKEATVLDKLMLLLGMKQEEDEMEEKDERKVIVRRKPNYMRIMFLVTAVVVVVSVLAHMFFGRDRKVVEVPNVVKMTTVEAKKLLEKKDFNVEIQETFVQDAKVPPGTVLDQTPKAGEKRKEGSLIILKASRGAESKNVPDIVGMSLTKAEQILSDNGFVIGKVTKTYDKKQKIGAILSQSPKAMEVLDKGKGIDIVVNEGDIPVPNVVGQKKEDAIKMIKAAKLEVGEIKTVTDANYAKDTVMAANPTVGMNLGEGDKVNLTISDGGQVRSVFVEFTVPGNKQTLIRITQKDSNGEKVLVQGMKKGGVRLRQKIEFTGKAKVQFFADNKLVEEKTL